MGLGFTEVGTARSNNIDRISSLPEGLVDHILSCLADDDLGVVVRTSVLSKRWRFCWTRMRKLRFDSSFFKKYASPKGLDVVVGIVDSVLSRHNGPLDLFSLYVVDTRGVENKALDLCRWMEVLSGKGIREMSLFATHCYVGSPSRILCCPSLTHLSLYWCDFGLSSEFSGSTSLVSLRLEGAVIHGSLLEAVIANSPSLSALELTDICIDDNYRVVIDAPGLASLCLSTAGEFCLKEYPSLTSAYLGLKFEVPMKVGRGRKCKLDNFGRLMPRVEKLTFDAAGLKALSEGDVPVKLTSSFENLKLLDFDELDILSVDQLSCFFCLIRSAPNLQSLDIYVAESFGADDGRSAAALGCYEAQKKMGTLSRLSTLRVDSMLGNDWEVTFISTFLHCCPVLEMVLFSFNEDIESDSRDWLCDELDKLQRAEAADIKFQSQNEEDSTTNIPIM